MGGALIVALRPSVLAVTSQMPWPLNSGGHLRTYHLLRSIAEHADVRLVVPSSRKDDPGVAALRQAGVTPVLVPVSSRNIVGESLRAAAAMAASQPYVLFTRHRRSAVRRALRREAQRARPDVLY